MSEPTIEQMWNALRVSFGANEVALGDGNGGIGGYEIWDSGWSKQLGSGRFNDDAIRDAWRKHCRPQDTPGDATQAGDLLPCPFCGVDPAWDADEGESHYQIFCQNLKCSISGAYTRGCTSKDEAVALWNRRAQPPAPDRSRLSAADAELLRTGFNDIAAGLHHVGRYEARKHIAEGMIKIEDVLSAALIGKEGEPK